jgi:hypothetical protein
MGLLFQLHCVHPSSQFYQAYPFESLNGPVRGRSLSMSMPRARPDPSRLNVTDPSRLDVTRISLRPQQFRVWPFKFQIRVMIRVFRSNSSLSGCPSSSESAAISVPGLIKIRPNHCDLMYTTPLTQGGQSHRGYRAISRRRRRAGAGGALQHPPLGACGVGSSRSTPAVGHA